MSNKKNMSFFEQLKQGLEDSLAYSRGELKLKTTTLPLPMNSPMKAVGRKTKRRRTTKR